MSLDEQIQQSFRTFGDAVREAVSRHAAAAADQVRASVDHERRALLEQVEQTARAAADLRAAAETAASAEADIERVRQAAYDEGFDAGRTDGWETGRQHGAIEGRHDARAEWSARELAAGERLVDVIRALDGARSVPDTLDVLLRGTAREAARAAIVLVRGQELQGWRFVGFGARVDNPTEFRQALVGSGVIEEAVRTQGLAYTHGRVRVPAPSWAELPAGRRAVSVPLVLQQRVVAAVYADQGPVADPKGDQVPYEGLSWPVAIEIMTRHASRCLEASAALKSALGSYAAPEPEQPSTARVARAVGDRRR
jgi:hypothetical protein